MKPLEEELKSALRRVEPPAGLLQHVMAGARMEASAGKRIVCWLREFLRPKPARWAAAVGFACLLLMFGAIRFRQAQEQKMQGEIASAQARLALHIASAKLNAVFKDAARSPRHDLEN